MKQDYSLSYTNIDIESKAFKFNADMFENNTMYLIPTEVFNNLKTEITTNETNNNYLFIKHYLEAVQMFIENSVKLFGLNYKKNKVNFKYVKYFYDDLIDSKTKYVTGQKSIKYTLKQHTRWTFLILDEVNDFFIKDFKNELPIDSPANNDLAIDTLCNTTINISAAINAEYERLFTETNELYNKDYSLTERNKLFVERIIRIATFHNSRFINKGKNVNRVYSSFSSLTSVSRKYVQYKNKYFYEVDIKNCQPLLLALLLIEEGYNIDKNYIDDVCNSIFYEQIQAKAKELNYTSETIIFNKFITLPNSTKERVFDYEETLQFKDRDDVKRLAYRSVYFKTKTIKTSKTAEIFNLLYPETYKSIRKYNKESEVELASVLQNKEADIVLTIIPTCSYFTVHDAIYLTDRLEVIKVKEILENKISNMSNNKLECKIKINDALEVSHTKSNNTYEKINITSKRKIETAPRKMKSNKENNLKAFSELKTKGLNRQEIINTLDISVKTYLRYENELKNMKVENIDNELKKIMGYFGNGYIGDNMFIINNKIVEDKKEVYVATKSDYLERLESYLPYAFLSSKDFKINKETILNELVKQQVKKKSEISLIIKNIIK